MLQSATFSGGPTALSFTVRSVTHCFASYATAKNGKVNKGEEENKGGTDLSEWPPVQVGAADVEMLSIH